MSKADELALTRCAKCIKRQTCAVPCSDVLVLLFLDSQKSPHEIQEIIKNARKRAGI